MRIAYVSTFPPIECGIGTYTQFLLDAMRKTPNELHVVSQFGAEGMHVYPTYSPTDEGIAKKIFDMAVKITPDVVHIQHEYGLFGELDGIAVLELVYRLKSTATPVIATFHTVNKIPEFRRGMILKTLCRELDGIIVHETEHVDILRDVYEADANKIHLIPHGARDIAPIPDAKAKLNLIGKKVLLLVGYFRPTKCFDKIVELFPRIVEQVPDAWLVISGKMRTLEFGTYRNTLFEKINNSPAKDRIEVFRGQFPQETFDTIIAASDIMCFPYIAGAQSGVMAHAFAFGKPVVTSDLPAFKSIVEKSKAGFTADSDDEYVDKIVKLLTDKPTYDICSQKAYKYVKGSISWDIVAEKTLDVYARFDQKLECATRYVYVG